jgi:isoquinoline 1-oxidoreductase beta subunit
MSQTMTGPSRRSVVQAAALGLVLGFHLPVRAAARDQSREVAPAVNAWLRIAPDGQTTIYVNSTDLGQGSQSGIAQVIAEEAGLDWTQVRIEQAPIEPVFFRGSGYSTGGSSAVAAQWEQLRKVGAAARHMLRQAAAEQWGVLMAECDAGGGKVVHAASGRTIGYGGLAARASRCDPPEDPPLTPRETWRLIGKSAPRLDIPLKVDGRAAYGVDVTLPGLLSAAVAQCPIYGGKLESVDEAAAMAVPGVRKVVRLPAWRDSEYVNMPLQETVAVLADGFWPASQGLAKLAPRWAPGAAPFGTAALYEQLRNDVRGPEPEPGVQMVQVVRTGTDPAEQRARAETAFHAATKVLDAEYELPFIAHLTMEPMSAAARWQGEALEIWSGSQAQLELKKIMNRRFGVAPEKVTVHTTYAGGGFGRRYYADAQLQAAALAKEVGAPVKVIWSRPEDTQHDIYRPPAVARFRAAIGRTGAVEAVEMRQARIAAFDFGDRYTSLGYAWPAFVGSSTIRPQTIPWGAWRAVEDGPQAFFVESFVDELAHATGQDPIAYRRRLLAHDARATRLLDALEERAGWRSPKAEGVGRGMAFWAHPSGSLAAQVVEVAQEGAGLKAQRVTCVFDCGTVVNPDNVRAQGESSILYALSAALDGEITFKDGRVEQANFDSYPVVRLAQAPEIEVHLLESPTAKVSGVGEPMLPPLAPALANAMFDLTGQRFRRLPILPSLRKAAVSA